MSNRIFPIDDDCYIIYTGQSSADEKSFLRIGNSGKLDKKIQNHIGYIVISDAEKIDYHKEKNDIKYMEKGKIRYICNKENQELLFSKLEELGVNENDLFHKDLSKDLDNISRIDNKKHFFTVFYENKNIRIVSDDEVYFELFASGTENTDFEEQKKRLSGFIDRLENLKMDNIDIKNKNVVSAFIDNSYSDKSSLFLLQDKVYIPLNPKMFKITSVQDRTIFFDCNCSARFYAGKDAQVAVVIDGKERGIHKCLISSGEVIESQILYSYKFSIEFNDEAALKGVSSIYNALFERAGL